MKGLFFAPLIFGLLVPGAYGQTTFFKKYPLSLSNCGYALAVSSNSMIGVSGLQIGSSGNRSILQGRVDPSGKPLFNQVLNTGSESDAPGGMAPTKDGGFILVSSSLGSDGTRDIILTRIRANGSLGWKRRIATNAAEYADRIVAVTGGYIVAGTTNLAGNTDVLILKINDAGAILWSKTYGDGEPEFGHSVADTGDGGAMVAGTKDGAPFVLRIDGAGNLIWARVLSITHPSVGRVAVARSGDAFYVAETGGGNGHNHGGPVEHTGIIVTRITLAGSVLWSRDYHSGQPSVLWHLSGTSDGKLVVSGNVGATSVRAFVFQLDSTGKIIWKKLFSEYVSSAFFSIEAPDGGILTTGCSGETRTELFILKTDAAGRLQSGCNKWLTAPLSFTARKDSALPFFPRVSAFPATASVPPITLNTQPSRTTEVCSTE